MSFDIRSFEENGFQIIALVDKKSQTQVEIIPAYGAMLHAFKIQHKGSQLNCIDGYRDKNDYEKEVRNSFKSVKLSPFACRINDGAYNWQSQQYKVEKTPIHGLLFDQAFTITQQQAEDAYASVTMQHAYKATDGGYPFTYTCHVQYRLLQDTQLEVTSTITNTHNATIPIMDGWHPYFTTGTPVDQLQLRMASTDIVEFNDKLIPTGKTLPYEAFEQLGSLNGVFLDNSFILNQQAKQPLASLIDPVKGITIDFYPQPSYPILQVYTPPHRNSIAIENLSGAPDAFNNGIGLVQLAPGQSKSFTTTIQITSK
ncbi:aldose 1-epimerase [Chitinophaga skermanii]|uniref:Aldose 1-epimerase n=1 Tax=Chitinophaga skermanii TaxID=331697 RepID=A0A327Q7I4_9BACT|nr:aldose 1-epimerase [Chitinophaga skermanii]RAJ00261.1 aldose 1-epimerase [Chitinophaga skermanii]